MKHRKGKGSLAAVFLLVFAVLAGSVPVRASTTLENEGIDTKENGQCSIELSGDGPSTAFHLYQVAVLQNDYTAALTDDFKNCGGTPEKTEEIRKMIQPENISALEESNADLRNLAATLENYAEENHLTGKGEDEFKNLSFGLYLILGDDVKEANQTVHYLPILICLPQPVNSVSSSWEYHPYDVTVKSETTNSTPGKQTESDTPSTPNKTESVTGTPSRKPGTRTPTTKNGNRTPSGTAKNQRKPGSSNPSKSGKTGKTNKSTGTANRLIRLLRVRTGDTVKVFIYLAIMVAAAALIIVLVVRKHHNR